MIQSPFEEKDIRWLEAELLQSQEILAEKEVALQYLQEIVEELRQRTISIESLLIAAKKSGLQSSGSLVPAQDSSSKRIKQRNPMDMLRSEYKGMKLSDIAASVLRSSYAPLTTPEMTRLIYETRNEDEFDRARNSLSAELRSGAKAIPARWKKVGRYAYISLESDQRGNIENKLYLMGEQMTNAK